MQILLLTNIFPNPWGVTQGPFNLELAKAIARQHELKVICPVSWVVERMRKPSMPVNESREEHRDGFEVHYPRFYYTPKILRGMYATFYWHSIRDTARRVLNAWTPGVVLGYWAHPDGTVAVRLARQLGVPGVVMVGGSDVLLLTRNASRRRHVVSTLRAADAVIATSHDLLEKLIALGVDSGRVHVAYRGVDTKHFCPGDRVAARKRLGLSLDARALLWVGRMVPVKRLDVLLRACEIVKNRQHYLRLHLVGDGPLRSAMERFVDARGLRDIVCFAGVIGHDALPDWYRAADLTLLTSSSEGVPNVLRESLACGTPFIASEVGGIPELGRELPNRLVPAGDPMALADAITAALDDPPCEDLPVCMSGWDESAQAVLRVLGALTGCPDWRTLSPPAHANHARQLANV
jgi:glycosyltransferase involved in cell wall biosynthesis